MSPSHSVPGPPLSSDTAITILMSKHVRVAIGVIDEYDARNIRFDVAWVSSPIIVAVFLPIDDAPSPS